MPRGGIVVSLSDLGFDPVRFPRWYPGQQEAVEAVVAGFDQGYRVVGFSGPTGAGKSLVAAAVHRMTGLRTAVLTQTKQLQTAYLAAFSQHPVSLTDIRGQNAYVCEVEPRYSVDLGPCHAGYDCPSRKGYGEEAPTCRYYGALHQSSKAEFVVTNYAYWIAQHRYGDGITERRKQDSGGPVNPFGLLVCDEADTVFDALSDALSVTLDRGRLHSLGIGLPGKDAAVAGLQYWAMETGPKVKAALESGLGDPYSLDVHIRIRLQELRSLSRALDCLVSSRGEWVASWSPRRASVTVSPVWPLEYLEGALYLGIPRIMLMSATLPEETVKMLTPDGSSYAYHEAESLIPVHDRPVVHVKTTDMRHDREDTVAWVGKTDQIVAARMDRKTVVQATSYARAQKYLQGSRFRGNGMLIGHGPREVEAALGDFRRHSIPAVLVSPALVRGADLPGPECEVIVILKVPWPDPRDPLVEARKKRWPDYPAFVAATALTQEAGRAVRYVGDRAAIIVLDDAFRWFSKKYARFFPQWFRDAWQGTVDSIPPPLPKLPS